MNRAQWLREVRRGDFPAGLRIARATLLLLPMTTEGTVTATNEHMADLTGLPVRTLSRHLAKAVDAGWLERITRGGVGARSRYRAAVPGVRHDWPTPQGDSAPLVAYSEAQECASSGGTSAPESTHSRGERVRHVVAKSIEDSANASELVALEQGRDRRPGHGGSRAAPDHGEPKGSTDGEHRRTNATTLPTDPLGANNPDCSECRRRTTTGDNSGCRKLTAGEYCPFPQLDIRAS